MALRAFDLEGYEIDYAILHGDFVVDDEKESVLEALRDRTNSNEKNRRRRNCAIGKIREK